MLALATGTAALAGVTVIDGDTLDVDGVRIRLLDATRGKPSARVAIRPTVRSTLPPRRFSWE